MAEVLIRAKTNGPNTTVHWQLGDIVVVVPDGHAWGRLETKAAWIAAGGTAETWPGGFWLIKVPGVTVAFLEYLLEQWVSGRRLWRLVHSELPNNIKNRLNNNGEITVGTDLTRANAEARVRRKDTEATATLG